MKEIAKYSGIIVMLIGVAVLAIPFFQGATNNINLLIGLILVIEGFFGHIYVNSMKKGTLLSTILWAIILLIVPFFFFFGIKKLAYNSEEYAF